MATVLLQRHGRNLAKSACFVPSLYAVQLLFQVHQQMPQRRMCLPMLLLAPPETLMMMLLSLPIIDVTSNIASTVATWLQVSQCQIVPCEPTDQS
jgi:hypothetical protein